MERIRKKEYIYIYIYIYIYMYVCITESLCYTTGINIVNQLNFKKTNKRKKIENIFWD